MVHPDPTLPPGEVVLKGLVLPAELDQDFQVRSLLLSTSQEEEIPIARDEKSRELLDHLRDLVRVYGRMEQQRDGRRVLIVNDFEVVGPN